MPAREKVVRGRNYDPVEDLELVRAWVHASTDASVGIDQTAKQLWEKVQEIMESSKPIAAALAAKTLEHRSWPSLQAHYGQIQMSIAKYVGCLKQVESMRQSGTTERDTIKKALGLYRKRNKHHFAYIECYDVFSKCPKFVQALDKLVERPRAGKRKSSEPEPEMSSENSTSATPSSICVTAAKRPSKGVTAAKRDKVGLAMQYRTVRAYEKLSKSLSFKVDVLKEQLLVNEAQQRLQEEQALHAMINALFSSTPTSPEHAAYLEKRRAVLLQRLDALGETASLSASKPTGGMPPPLQQDATPLINAGFPPPPASNQQGPLIPVNAGSDPLSSVFPTPNNSCPPSPGIMDSSSTLLSSLPAPCSLTPSSLTAESFPPLTTPSQPNESMSGLRVLDV
ncbi:unnamed protein product [Phytophthora fragariaefolia]|uniref:Unnamed protein product n=1 Tax=Phytophthora fragariaefolia TaxID=1490495 RepID=A0A9W6Y880_9STRA|nr:unnamed protein product [Phytophthora fragariaefolia]